MFKKLFGRAAAPVASPAKAPATTMSTAVERARQLVRDGNRLEDAGQFQEACAVYRQAIAAAPDWPGGHLNLGLGLAAAGDLPGAEAAYRQVLALEPTHPYGCYNQALVCYRRGDRARAEELVRQAVRSKPDFPEAQLLLANVLDDAGHTEAALIAAREAARLAPDFAGAHYNCAFLLHKVGRGEEGMAPLLRSLEIDPSRAESHSLLASLYTQQGFMAEALTAIRECRRLGGPEPDVTASKELFYLNFDESIGRAEMFDQHLAYGRQLEAAAPIVYTHSRPADTGPRRLRLAYLSGDLRAHPVALFLLPALERRNRDAFEVYCYSTGERKDHITERLASLVDHWLEVRSLGDDELAARIHADRIDILVDLSGHSGALRLGVFAQKPAPVQLSWMGYLNTSGLKRMDWRICDERTDPAHLSAQFHSERLLSMPHSQWCYRPFLQVPASPLLPADANGYLTFGSFNQAAKVTLPMCRRWAAILLAVAKSRLLIADVAFARKKAVILQVMEQAGVDPARVEFTPRLDVEAYYRQFERVDLALDTFPYSGGTTTFDALAHGVPVVTALGTTPFSRSAGSILAPLGLAEWVADTIDGYVDVAVRRAGDLVALRELRQALPARLGSSPFMDEPRFVADLEAAFMRTWSVYLDADAGAAELRQ